MKRTRQQFNQDSYPQKFANHPKVILLVALLVCLFFASFLPQLKVASTVHGLLPEGSEEIVTFDDMRERYGKSDYIILAVIGKPVINIEYLRTLRRLHEAVAERVPYINTVQSLVNARHIHGVNGEVIVEDLLQNQPETAEDLEWVRERLDANPAYYGRLINEHENTSAIFIQLATHVPSGDASIEPAYRQISELDIAQSLEELDLIRQEYEGEFEAQIVLGGETAMLASMANAISGDFKLFTGLSVSIACLLLSVFFRRVSGVLMPMFTMGLSIVISMALLPLMGFSIQLTTSVLPSFLLTICVGDAVHLLTSFYRHFDAGLPKRAAVAKALSQCQVPIMMTSLTTTAGLVALAISVVVPIKTLGIIAGAGCLLAWLTTVIVLPALILVFPLKRRSEFDGGIVRGLSLQRFIMAFYRVSTTYPRWVISTAALILVLSVFSALKLEISNNPQAWFAESNPIRLAITQIEENLSGSTMFEVVVHTGREEGVYDPEFLRRVDAWLAEIENTDVGNTRIGQANSIIQIIKETNKVLNSDSGEHYTIPSTRGGVAQVLLLVEMDRAEDLYKYTDETFSEVRVLLLINAVGARDIMLAQKEIEAVFAGHLGDVDMLQFTGMAQIMPKILLEIGDTMIRGYLIGAALIALMMMLMMKSIRLGLIAMVPNLFPVTVVLGYMNVAGIPLDIFTVVMVPIALGIAVDDTMHFMHRVRSFYQEHGDTRRAIRQSFTSVGQALVITTVSLFCGFMIYGLSALESLSNFGSLMALSVVLALLADFLLAPALLVVLLENRTVGDDVKNAHITTIEAMEEQPRLLGAL